MNVTCKCVWRLEDTHNSANLYFQMTNIMPQNHALVKEPLKVQNRPLDFNVAGYKKFIDTASDSTLQLWFKNDLYSSAIVSKEDIQKSHLKRLSNDQSSLFQIHVYVRSDFLRRLQPKQHSNRFNIEADMRIQLPYIKPDIRI